MSELGVVETWLDAINRRDVGAAVAVSQPEIEVVGPRGRGSMLASALGEWLARSGFSGRPVRWFCGGDGRVVVELDAQWTDPISGAPQDNLMIGASVRVDGGGLAAFERFDNGLSSALEAAGLDPERHEVTVRA
jgi:hypothetical protein